MLVSSILSAIIFIQNTLAISTYDELVYSHQRFIRTFDQMMDISAIESAKKSYQRQFTSSSSLKQDETLTIHETMEMSNMYKNYLKEQMRIYSFQDFKDAATNRKRNFYVWNEYEKMWINYSSGQKLYDEFEAETANINLLLETLDSTYLKLLYPDNQGLEKRRFKFTLPKRPTKPTQPTPEVDDEGIWSKLFGESQNPPIKDKGRWARLKNARKQVTRDIQLMNKLISHPIVKPWLRSKKVDTADTKKPSVFAGAQKKVKKARKVYYILNHPTFKPYMDRYKQLNKLQYFSPDPKIRQTAAEELNQMRYFLQCGENILDSIADIFMCGSKCMGNID